MSWTYSAMVFHENISTALNFGILPVLVFQMEVYYKVDRLLTGLTAQQKGTAARWYSNKTPLLLYPNLEIPSHLKRIKIRETN